MVGRANHYHTAIMHNTHRNIHTQQQDVSRESCVVDDSSWVCGQSSPSPLP